MILLIDNYDSFTFNLYQMLSQYERVEVIRNDGKTVEEIEAMKPAGIVLSPGPGRPENSGICPQVIRSLRGKIPILGVCLGEQAICQVYGGTVSHAIKPMHGRQSEVDIVEDSELFKGLGRKMKVARYHSLIAEEESLEGTELRITGKTKQEEVMAVEDSGRKVYGVQFHPESIMTKDGAKILENFARICKGA
ncbi:aminodeoxychorismate/anthranilate synthase component II [Oribacterium sinus]|uniref:anthranilate synthase component II n=1 Tax=Oribacterium sinus TaxID=237576 RepID=UPI0028E79A3D|nr:aminodeoxychorismate/anthranilate synthase component II [Oribacterium sinus]